jgi:D-amino-acid dehydrogenase
VKVAVVGTGVFGASCAFHLAQAGAAVVMIDPAREGRATAAGAGIICPWSSAVTDEAYYRLSSSAARYYPELIAALHERGETDTGYGRVGALNVPADATALDALERKVRDRVALAPEAGAVSRLSPDETRALFPPLREGQAALHIEGAARVDGRLLAAALTGAAVRLGAARHDGAAELMVEAGRVTGVTVDGETIAADRVVVTAGAWAPALLQRVGIHDPVQPQRGQIVHLHLPGVDTASWPVVLPMTSTYMLAFPGSRVVIGATRETGSGFDYRLTAAGMMEVLQTALAVAPGLADATILETRIGFRPAGQGIRPVLALAPGIEGLVLGNGLWAGGLTVGPYAGRLLAQLTLGAATDIDLAPYRISSPSPAGGRGPG